MTVGEPLCSLASAIYSALHKDASEIEYTARNRIIRRRPLEDEVEVFAMFLQSWGSTSLGFGGIGGQAFTDAYTVVLQVKNEFLVYFAGRFAYRVTRPSETFFKEVSERSLQSVARASRYISGGGEDEILGIHISPTEWSAVSETEL